MSFEIYIQCFKDGEESAGLSRKKIRAAFGPFVTETEPGFWQLKYDPSNSCEVLLAAKGQMVTGFTVLRPCEDARLWESLIEILKLGNVVLYFPGEGCPLVADESVIPHLPADMVETLGRPKCIKHGAEIQQAIKDS
jgi:hypothetical protein